MSNEAKKFPVKGFTTLVVSDLHLTEEQKPLARAPLWKKFKSKEFFFDHIFADWLDFQTRTETVPIELVLNGDIFDFDSVTRYPEKPTFKVSSFEKSRTLFSQKEKSLFKIDVIIETHPIWFDALRAFVEKGNKVVFVIGNHDLELHYEEVQRKVRKAITNESYGKDLITFCEWFYISHEDTHIEHGNQYDPYCVCQTPVFPLIKAKNDFRIRIPFGNLVARYMVNSMGFINPHSEDNYMFTLKEYINFFVNFLIKNQPFIVWTWFYNSVVVTYRSILYRLREPVIDPFSYEEKVERIAKKSNATERMVRELLALAVPSAVSSPWSILQVLWIDRVIIFLISIVFILQIFLLIDQIVDISLFWVIVPLVFFTPFFVFYSSTVKNVIKGSKDPGEQRLRWISILTKTRRVIFGHTHEVKHEIIGSVEHLNPGSWSPVFKDLECTQALTRYAYIKIKMGPEGRIAYLNEWKGGENLDYYSGKNAE